MKKLKLLIAAITFAASYSVTAQVAVNTDGSSPNASAMLDVKSDTSGILIPRMTQAEADGNGYRGTDEGGKLKEAGLTHWFSPNEGATNSSGFTGLPGGEREEDGSFFTMLGYHGDWWSAIEFSSSEVWCRGLHHTQEFVSRINDTKTNGFSVRCVKD